MTRMMKDSSIEWIGAVPKDWEIVKLKHLTVCLDGMRIPIASNDRESGIYPYWGAGSIQGYINDYIFDEEIILLGEDGAPFFDKTREVAFLINEKVWVNNHIHVLKGVNCNNKFIVHFLNIVDYANYINGSILNKLTQNNMKNISIATPPLEEQKRIADYLDKKCTEIEGVRESIEAEIATLEEYKKSMINEAVTKGLDKDCEMKDSGIEWIGEVPKHWKVSKVKHNLSRTEERNPGNQQILSVYREYGVIPKDSRDDNYNVTSLDTSNYKYVKHGYLVINKMKAWQGSMGISDYTGVVSPAYYIYKLDYEKIYPLYLHNLFRTVYIDEFRRISGGIREGQWDLSAYLFENTYMPVPPISEQKAIADYLDHKTNLINEAIEGKRAQLFSLDEYKKSLIYEYVTGKKEVPHEDAL